MIPVVQEPSMSRLLLQMLIGAGSATVAISTLGAAFLWLVKPRIQEWVRREVTKPVQETHKSVTVNGGRSDPPTLLDQVHTLSGQMTHVITATGANAQRASDLADRMDDLHDLAKEARDMAKQSRDEVREHEAKGEQYLGKVRLVMKTQGIDLPDADR